MADSIHFDLSLIPAKICILSTGDFLRTFPGNFVSYPGMQPGIFDWLAAIPETAGNSFDLHRWFDVPGLRGIIRKLQETFRSVHL